MAATAFQVHIPDEEIRNLHEKLSVSQFPDELEDTGWAYGAPLADVQRLAQKWRNEFDWRRVEEDLNKYPQFTMKITTKGFEMLDVHFIHQRSDVKNAIPLLFVHGWPGSYIEVTKLLPMLDGSNGGPAFHIVAPSLPSFGWSSGTKKKGWGPRQYADTFNQLMQKLGYELYVTQGGDLGFSITRAMGIQFPNQCRASHLNMPRALKPKWAASPLLALQNIVTPYSKRDKGYLARAEWFKTEGSAYRDLQRTRPQTLAYALRDSPLALLGWMYEKLHDWVDAYPWTDEEILTWVSLYWFSNAGPHASVRYYYETMHCEKKFDADALVSWVPKVKLGLSYFPKELSSPPKLFGRTLGPVVFEAEHDRGGHFAAWEQPDLLADDLKHMFGKTGPCAKIIPGKSGYD